MAQAVCAPRAPQGALRALVLGSHRHAASAFPGIVVPPVTETSFVPHFRQTSMMASESIDRLVPEGNASLYFFPTDASLLQWRAEVGETLVPPSGHTDAEQTSWVAEGLKEGQAFEALAR